MNVGKLWRVSFLPAALALASSPANAHHVMDGNLPTTFMQGLLSGLGHPVIGPDHFAFILAIGVAAAIVPAGMGLIAAFVAASTAGVLIHVGAGSIAYVEVLVAASVVAAAAALAFGDSARSTTWLTLAAGAGIVHGMAFGETIVGAEQGVLGGYLLGLGLVSAAIAAAVALAVNKVTATPAAQLRLARVSSFALAAFGAVLVAGSMLTV